MHPERDVLKVLTVSPYKMGERTIGGVQNYITSLRSSLEAKGCEVTILAPSVGKKEENLADRTFGMSFPVSMTKTSYKAGFSLNLLRARNLMTKVSPDVVWFHDPFASFLTTAALVQGLRLSEVQSAASLLGHAYREELTSANKVLLALGWKLGVIDFISKRIEGRGAVGPPSAEFWANILREEKESFDILPNPINTEFFTPEGPIFENWDDEDGARILFFAGRHDKRKRLDVLIDSFSILRREGLNVKPIIAGDGDETSNAMMQVEDLGLKDYVKFLGRISDKDLAKAYRTVGRLEGRAIGSSDDGEAFNRVNAEAKASGCQVVATNIPGHRLSYGDENIFGEMAKPGDPEDLAAKIKDQLESSQEIQDARRVLGIEYVRGNFSLDNVSAKVVAHLEKTVSLKREGVIYER